MTAVVDNTALFRAQTQILSKKLERLRNEEKEKKGILLDGQKGVSKFTFYCCHARQILTDITELRDLVLDKRKEYILCSNAFSLYGVQKFMSDEDRRKFDQETDLAFKHCTKLIRSLETQIESDRALRQPDELRHLLAVTNLLNIYLKDVLTIVTQLRTIHIRKSRQIRRICRLANLVEMYGSRLEHAQKEEEEKVLKLSRLMEELKVSERRHGERDKTTEENKENVSKRDVRRPELIMSTKTEEKNIVDGWEDAQIGDEELLAKPSECPKILDGWEEAQIDEGELLKSYQQQPRPMDACEETQSGTKDMLIKAKVRPKPVDGWEAIKTEEGEQVKVEQSQLIEENKKLFERFTATDSELSKIETQMSEIQRLQGIFAEKINEQEQEIDIIHSRTVYTLDNLETANEFIREAIKNQANRRVILIFCLLVLTFTLLFLDWYNP